MGTENREDNQDFDLENLEEEEEKTDAEDEEESSDAEEEDKGEGEEDDAGADEGEDDGEGDDKKFVIPEKFKGKKVEDVAKSYVELEKSIQKKATEIARDMIEKQSGKRKPAEKKEDDDAIKAAMKGVDFSKMKPEEFAAWLIKTVEQRAQEIARNTYEAADSTKSQVQTEINSVTKVWPQLKENEGFRDMVLALIENAAGKGEILTLKEACVKVGKSMGLKPGAKKPAEGEGDHKSDEGEGEKKKKPNLGVERPAGAGGGEKQTEEEKILSGLTAGKTPGGLGGLY